jgi:hypothetical protein
MIFLIFSGRKPEKFPTRFRVHQRRVQAVTVTVVTLGVI